MSILAVTYPVDERGHFADWGSPLAPREIVKEYKITSEEFLHVIIKNDVGCCTVWPLKLNPNSAEHASLF